MVTPDRKPYAQIVKAWAVVKNDGNYHHGLTFGPRTDVIAYPGERVVRVEIRPIKRKKVRRG